MTVIAFHTTTAEQPVEVFCLESHKEVIAENLDNFATFNSKMDHLMGSDCLTSHILFIKHENIQQVEKNLNAFLLLQEEELGDCDEEPVYYMKFECAGSDYTIYVHNYDEGMDISWKKEYPDNLEEIENYLDKIDHYTSFSIVAGAENNDWDFFLIMRELLAIHVKDIILTEEPNYLEYEKQLATYCENQDNYGYSGRNLVKNYNITIEQAMYFYKLAMQKLYLKMLHLRNKKLVDIYLYKKIVKKLLQLEQ